MHERISSRRPDRSRIENGIELPACRRPVQSHRIRAVYTHHPARCRPVHTHHPVKTNLNSMVVRYKMTCIFIFFSYDVQNAIKGFRFLGCSWGSEYTFNVRIITTAGDVQATWLSTVSECPPHPCLRPVLFLPNTHLMFHALAHIQSRDPMQTYQRPREHMCLSGDRQFGKTVSCATH